MDWKAIVSKISAAAPMVGTLLGGPAGGAVGGIISMVASALGCEPSQDAVATAVMGDPEALLKLRQLESSHALELQRMILADIADARKRQTDHEKATGKTDVNLYVLAWVIVSGFFLLLGLLLWIKLPPDSSGVIFMLFGALSTGFGQVLQYFFGSSKSSQAKTDLLAKAEPVK